MINIGNVVFPLIRHKWWIEAFQNIQRSARTCWTLLQCLRRLNWIFSLPFSLPCVVSTAVSTLARGSWASAVIHKYITSLFLAFFANDFLNCRHSMHSPCSDQTNFFLNCLITFLLLLIQGRIQEFANGGVPPIPLLFPFLLSASFPSPSFFPFPSRFPLP